MVARDAGPAAPDAGVPCSDAIVRLTSGSGERGATSAAWGGSSLGVAWQDTRDADLEIYFARYTLAGERVGPEVRVTDALGGSQGPALAWNGTEWAVGWLDGREPAPGIYFRVLDAAGAPRGPELLLVAQPPSRTLWGPAIAWNGRAWAVVWSQSDGADADAFFLTIDGATGRPSAAVPIAATAVDEIAPDVVWTGREHVVLWEAGSGGSYGLFLRRVDAAGALAGAAVSLVGSPGNHVGARLAWSGTEVGVAWIDYRGGGSSIWFARYEAGGGVRGAPAQLSPYPGEAWSSSPVFDGRDFVVAWTDSRSPTDAPDLYARRIDPDTGVAEAERAIARGAGVQLVESVAPTPWGTAVLLEDEAAQISMTHVCRR